MRAEQRPVRQPATSAWKYSTISVRREKHLYTTAAFLNEPYRVIDLTPPSLHGNNGIEFSIHKRGLKMKTRAPLLPKGWIVTAGIQPACPICSADEILDCEGSRFLGEGGSDTQSITTTRSTNMGMLHVSAGAFCPSTTSNHSLILRPSEMYISPMYLTDTFDTSTCRKSGIHHFPRSTLTIFQ